VVLKNAEQELTTPSVVYFESEGLVNVGNSAKEYALMYPDKVASQIKRHMGEKNYTCFMNNIDMKPEEIRLCSKKSSSGCNQGPAGNWKIRQ